MKFPRMFDAGRVVAVASLVLLSACAPEPLDPESRPTQRGLGLTVIDGNPTCAELGYAEEFRIDQSELTPGAWSHHQQGELAVSIFTPDGVVFDWEANLSQDAVLAKGGDGANLYAYDPEAMSDTGLVSPDNSSGGPAAISHISFCYDFEVVVSKTANTSFQRRSHWSIEKVARLETNLVLALGQSFFMPYTVDVWSTKVDSDWAVSGSIDVHNPSGEHSAIISSVTDGMTGGITPSVSCGVSFPHTLGAGESLSCSYFSSLPDGTDRINVAMVQVAEGSRVGGNVGSADVTFGEPSLVVDACVTVMDNWFGGLGVTCQPAATMNYPLIIGPYTQCGPHEHINVASFVTNNTGSTGSDSVTVNIDVPCPPDSCTLTPGYWKTHSEHGPAPYDDTWATLAAGADTPFFLSGDSYHGVLWTAPQGNTYYILARAWIAAQLNGFNGSDLGAVGSEFADAQAMLETYEPADFRKTRSLRRESIALAGVLDDYNNGLIGAGHCSEDTDSGR